MAWFGAALGAASAAMSLFGSKKQSDSQASVNQDQIALARAVVDTMLTKELANTEKTKQIANLASTAATQAVTTATQGKISYWVGKVLNSINSSSAKSSVLPQYLYKQVT